MEIMHKGDLIIRQNFYEAKRKETEKLRIMQMQEEMKWEKKKRKVP